MLDYEAAFGPALDALRPDAVHAHDMHRLRVASRAAAQRKGPAARCPGSTTRTSTSQGCRSTAVGPRGSSPAGPISRPTSSGDADRVVTVSPAIAAALQERYDLPRRPTVVLNVPTRDPDGSAPVVPVREVCGLGPDVPLISYSGAMQAARGVQTAIDAMVQLPDVHLALVCVPHNDTWFVRLIRESVEALGVQDRVHLINPVGPGQVVDYLRGIDVGLIPGLSFPSHEMSLPRTSCSSTCTPACRWPAASSRAWGRSCGCSAWGRRSRRATSTSSPQRCARSSPTSPATARPSRTPRSAAAVLVVARGRRAAGAVRRSCSICH